MKRFLTAVIITALMLSCIAGCGGSKNKISESDRPEELSESVVQNVHAGDEQGQDGTTDEQTADKQTADKQTADKQTADGAADQQETVGKDAADRSEEDDSGREIRLDPSWEYAEFSKIHAGTAVLYRSASGKSKGKVVCVNAGHGTKGGESVTTQCHPDGSEKVVSGSTSAGSTRAAAVSSGMTFDDGTPESEVTLKLALILKEDLLSSGYDVLMIRETDDVQLDNIARTVIANQNADCHIALHWDSSSSDKGAFYISAPDGSYRKMEPVASHWQEHEALGQSLIDGLDDAGVSIFSDGKMAIDLTQTSYSTIPSVDIELGDAASDHGKNTLKKISGGLVNGIDRFFE